MAFFITSWRLTWRPFFPRSEASIFFISVTSEGSFLDTTTFLTKRRLVWIRKGVVKELRKLCAVWLFPTWFARPSSRSWWAFCRLIWLPFEENWILSSFTLRVWSSKAWTLTSASNFRGCLSMEELGRKVFLMSLTKFGKVYFNKLSVFGDHRYSLFKICPERAMSRKEIEYYEISLSNWIYEFYF